MVVSTKNHLFPVNPGAKHKAEIIMKRCRAALDELYGPNPPEEGAGMEETLLALIHRMDTIIRLEEAKEAFNSGSDLNDLQHTLLTRLLQGEQF